MGAAASMSTADTAANHHDDPHISGVAPRRRSTLILSPTRRNSIPDEGPSNVPLTLILPPSPSLSALQGVLLQAVCTKELRRFAELSWCPGSSADPAISTADTLTGDDAYFLEEGKTIALNCIDFISEVNLPALLPACLPCHTSTSSVPGLLSCGSVLFHTILVGVFK